MSEKNLTLLTQDEIDTLVEFLVDKKSEINDEVLNQNSIDKLIYLIRNRDGRKLRMDFVNPGTGEEGPKVLVNLGFAEREGQLCRLDVRVAEDTSYLELYAVNTETGKEVKITPHNFSHLDLEENEQTWGVAIVPAFFDEVASSFGLKYTRETLERVCSIFADKNFGDKDMDLPMAFVPSSRQILANIIER